MNRKIGRKPDRKIPVPKNGDELIVLTGLVHVETGRQFAFCTQEGAEGFFLGPEDMARPDGRDDRVARCKYCKVEGTEEAETHWIVDFRTALAEGRVDTENGDHVISDLSLINNLVGVRVAGSVAITAPARKAATS